MVSQFGPRRPSRAFRDCSIVEGERKGRKGGQRGCLEFHFRALEERRRLQVHERRPTTTHLSADAEQMHARAINEGPGNARAV